MSKKECCCGTSPDNPEDQWFCCNPRLKQQFVTLFGPLMHSAVPVSPLDLISLKINRPRSRETAREVIYGEGGTGRRPCNWQECCTPCAVGACSNCKFTRNIRDKKTRCSVGPGGIAQCDCCTDTCQFCDTCPSPGSLGDSCCQEGISDCGEPIMPPGQGRFGYEYDCVDCCETYIESSLCRTANTCSACAGFLSSQPQTNSVTNKGIFKNIINKFIKEPLSYKKAYKPVPLTTLELRESIKEKNKNILEKQKNQFTAYSKNSVRVTNDLTAGDVFREKLNSLYPQCRKCLEQKGYDLDCVAGSNDSKCINSKSSTIDYCTECGEECSQFCNAYFGQTWQQEHNINLISRVDEFNSNYHLVGGVTLDRPSFWLGKILVNSSDARIPFDPNKISIPDADIMEKLNGIDQTTIEDSFSENSSYSNKYPIKNKLKLKSGIGGSDSDLYECARCHITGGAPGSAPLYMIYRFTGCHTVWYPPESIFNYQPKIPQGSGYYQKRGNGGQWFGCDFLLFGSHSSAGNEANLNLDCEVHYYYGGCPNSLACKCRDRTNFPCQCYLYPHISGGIYDTVKRRWNMSTKSEQGGYIPYLNPFAPPMKIEEGGCMACYNSASPSTPNGCSPSFETRRQAAANWPKASALGGSTKVLGPWCNTRIGSSDYPFYNPNYKTKCFERGISPYLSRIATDLYPCAREIFHYGSALPAKQELLMHKYTATSVPFAQNKWNANFKKLGPKRSSLFHKMVGLIGIEYHFESWAYHSKSLFAPAPPATMNHCRLLVSPYERPYGGTITSSAGNGCGNLTEGTFTYDPREALRYQMCRSFPRRVMYQSSTIPVFHSDLHAMEILSKKYNIIGDDGQFFDGEDFISDFYTYFYNMAIGKGDTIFNEPLVTETDVAKYDRVSFWIQKMIENNILSVKDHAPDIAFELKEILDAVQVDYVVVNEETGQEQRIISYPDELTAATVGFDEGYNSLLNWVLTKLEQDGIDLPEESKQREWSIVKNLLGQTGIDGKFIKSHLVNYEGQASMSKGFYYGPGEPVTKDIFAAPRRAKLWPIPKFSGLTTWGCENPGQESGDCCRDPISVLNIKTSDPNISPNECPGVCAGQVPDVERLTYTNVYSGHNNYFAVTADGSIRCFGPDAIAPFEGTDETTLSTYPDYVVGYLYDDRNICKVSPVFDAPGSNSIYTTSVGAVPEHLSVAKEIASIVCEAAIPEYFGGYTEKISCKSDNFAVALVSYPYGAVAGAHLWGKEDYADYGPNKTDDNRSPSPGAIGQPPYNDPRWEQFAESFGDTTLSEKLPGSTPLERQSYKHLTYSNSGSFSLFTGSPVFGMGDFGCQQEQDQNSPITVGALKAWGKGVANTAIGIIYNDPEWVSDYCSPACYGRNYIPLPPPLVCGNQDVIRHIFNKSLAWRDVAVGAKHMICLTDDGALLASPRSDNTYNQSSYGYPTFSGRREPFYTAKGAIEPDGQPGLTYSQGLEYSLKALTDYESDEGLLTTRKGLKYYKHMPKPGYFTDYEWDRLFQRTDNINPDLKYPLGPTFFYNTKAKPKWDENGIETRNENTPPCDIRGYLYSVSYENSLTPSDPNVELGNWLHIYPPGSEQQGVIIPQCSQSRPGYPCTQVIETDFPVWTQVACGHYHSMALSSDNNLKMWGSWVKIDNETNVLSGASAFYSDNPVPVRLPDAEVYEDQWTLSGWTYGCANPYYSIISNAESLNQFKIDNPNWQELLQPYQVATKAHKTVNASKEITAIDGGPDYSILARKASADEAGNPWGVTAYKFVIWGNPEMVSSVSGVTYPKDLTYKQYSRWYRRIEKIVAGPNSIAVLHKLTGGVGGKLDIFVRPGVHCGFTAGVGKADYSDIALTNGSVAAIYNSGYIPSTWKAGSFDSLGQHDKLQFRDFGNLPIYFQSQAFFRAVPGKWDYSKWHFGSACHYIGTDNSDTIIDKPDPCSIYYTKDTTFGKNLAYSGFPQYYWMRSSWRRTQMTTPTHSYNQRITNTTCGMIRDSSGADGLRPNEDGTGRGDVTGSIGEANRALNNSFGACMGGDVCWVADGSPSAYAWVRPNGEGLGGLSDQICSCDDKVCGCPPTHKVPIIWNCRGTFVAETCFESTINNRIGYTSNKDYFVCVAKTFGRLNPTTDRTGRCCGVVQTNVTAFFYAKRKYHYGYNAGTGLFEVQDAPRGGFRTYYLGELEGVSGSTYGIGEKPDYRGQTFYYPFEKVLIPQLVNDLMIPKNTISKYSYSTQSAMSYPPIYCGGRDMEPLKDSMGGALAWQDTGCDVCHPVPGQQCPSTCGGYDLPCVAPPSKLLGPGGWIHSYGPSSACGGGDDRAKIIVTASDGIYGQNTVQTLNNTVVYNYERLIMPAIHSDPWLGPLASFKLGWGGTFPPGFQPGCQYFCKPVSAPPPNPLLAFVSGATQCFTCTCDRNLYPTGGCTDGRQSCPGCSFIGWQYIDDSFLFELQQEYSIDNESLYFPGVEMLPDTNEPVGLDEYYLHRTYQKIPSRIYVGCTGPILNADPICFLGIDGVTNAGDFAVSCCIEPDNTNPEGPPLLNINGHSSNILCTQFDDL